MTHRHNVPSEPRRNFLKTASLVGVAAALTPVSRLSAAPQPQFSALKNIDAGDLNVAYAEVGPPDGVPVLLLHGWPYDIRTYGDASRSLAVHGYRVIVPYLRGYGPTRFRSPETLRNGQQAALATDAIALLDALKLDRVVVAGCDWGARSACVLAAAWPERCKALVSVSGYLIGNREANKVPLTPEAELSWWYQFYFATERGRAGYAANTREFAKLIWQRASPRWKFTEKIFAESAVAFDNPDHAEIVIHNYRWRLGLADGERKYDALETMLGSSPLIRVPTITLEGDANGAPHPDAKNYASKFSGKYAHRVVTGGIGHNLPQEAPEAFARAVIDAERWSR
ncbi:MAG: alpha/beta hydrolase [Polyangiales bacterium]